MLTVRYLQFSGLDFWNMTQSRNYPSLCRKSKGHRQKLNTVMVTPLWTARWMTLLPTTTKSTKGMRMQKRPKDSIMRRLVTMKEKWKRSANKRKESPSKLQLSYCSQLGVKRWSPELMAGRLLVASGDLGLNTTKSDLKAAKSLEWRAKMKLKSERNFQI